MSYPDTPTGVRRLLHDESDLHPEKLAGARIQPDPGVPGTWLVTLTDGTRILAYVGAHPLAPGLEEVEA